MLFYISWQERHGEDQRREAMIAIVDEHIAQERIEYIELVNYSDSLSRAVLDSIMTTYKDNDPLREQYFQLWNRKELELDSELYPQLLEKAKP